MLLIILFSFTAMASIIVEVTSVDTIVEDQDYTLSVRVYALPTTGATNLSIEIDGLNSTSNLSKSIGNVSTVQNHYWNLTGYTGGQVYSINVTATDGVVSDNVTFLLTVNSSAKPVLTHTLTANDAYADEISQIYVNVTNTGDKNDTDVEVKLNFEEGLNFYGASILGIPIIVDNTTSSGKRYLRTNLSNIGINESIIVVFNVTSSTADTYDVRSVIEWYGVALEDNLNLIVNDALTSSLKIISMSGESNSNLKNVVLTNYTYDIPVVILNNGTTTINNLRIEYFLNGTSIDNSTYASLASATQLTDTLSYTFNESEVYNVSVVVSSDNTSDINFYKTYDVLLDKDSNNIADETQSFIGNSSTVTTTGIAGDVYIYVNESSMDQMGNYSGTLLVEVKNALNVTLFEFDHDFSADVPDLSSTVLKLYKSTVGGMIVNGLNGYTKTFYIPDIDTTKDHICVNTDELNDISSISSACSGSSEVLLNCTASGITTSGYTCTNNVNLGGSMYYKVEGLTSSAVVESSYTAPGSGGDDDDNNDNNNGGGSSDGSATVTKFELTKQDPSYEVVVKKDYNMNLEINDKRYNFYLDQVNLNSILLQFGENTDHQFLIYLNENKSVDIDKDGVNDIKVNLEKIIYPNKAYLIFTLINTDKTVKVDVIDKSNETETKKINDTQKDDDIILDLKPDEISNQTNITDISFIDNMKNNINNLFGFVKQKAEKGSNSLTGMISFVKDKSVDTYKMIKDDAKKQIIAGIIMTVIVGSLAFLYINSKKTPEIKNKTKKQKETQAKEKKKKKTEKSDIKTLLKEQKQELKLAKSKLKEEQKLQKERQKKRMNDLHDKYETDIESKKLEKEKSMKEEEIEMMKMELVDMEKRYEELKQKQKKYSKRKFFIFF